MNWKTNFDRVTTFVYPALPPRFVHWKTLLLISVVIWTLSFIAIDEEGRDTFAALGWLLLTISIGWRTTQPPFILGRFPLSPWIVATLISLLIYQRSYQTDPTLAFKAWPVLAAVLIILIERIKHQNPEKSPPLIGRKTLVMIILIHCLIAAWMEIYVIILQESENSPLFNPNRTAPRTAFDLSTPDVLKSDQQFHKYFKIKKMGNSLEPIRQWSSTS